MKPLRPHFRSKATVRYETKPGQQAQVDWGHFRANVNGKQKRLYAFVMVLSYSHDVCRIYRGRKTGNTHRMSSSGLAVLWGCASKLLFLVEMTMVG